MAFEHDLSLSVDGIIAVQLNIAFIEHEYEPDELSVKIFKEDKTRLEAEAVWHVWEKDGEISLQITTQNIITGGVCLAGCLAGIVPVAGPLMKCLRGAKSRDEARKCIDLYAVAGAVGSLSCIYMCLNL